MSSCCIFYSKKSFYTLYYFDQKWQ